MIKPFVIQSEEETISKLYKKLADAKFPEEDVISSNDSQWNAGTDLS